MTRRKHTGRPAPIMRGVFLGFFGFALAVIALLWILQTFFLDDFYYWLLRRQTASSVSTLISMYDETDGETYAAQAQKIAADQSVCLTVFRCEPGSASAQIYVSYDASVACVLHHMSSQQINTLYRALQDGKHAFRVNREDLRGGDYGATSVARPVSERLIYADSKVGADGCEIIALVDAAIAPVSSTVSTLRLQLVVISGMILVVAGVLSWLVSRRISRPIQYLNSSAKHLAEGKYDVDFHIGGYREITELSDTLNMAEQDLSRVDRMQKELIANISHDLRTPLTMIIGYGEVMRDIEGENTPENIQVIIDEAKRLSSLVSDLLELSRYQAGERQMKPEHFDLSQTLREVVERYARLKEHSGFTFSYESDGEAEVDADRSGILQVICNLINNAVHYSTDDLRIEVRLRLRNGVARVEVTDHGEGIPQEQLHHIWKRYYKVDRAHKRPVSGSGLGLSIVQEILDLHHAVYGVDSIEGKGSTFWFELPLFAKQA